jgi:predicted helicase
MDRVDKNGIVSFITNRSFIDSRTFDGFRKCIQDDFDYCYIIDTKSDVRANPKIAGTTHNVFGIQTGVAMMFLVRKEKRNKNGCQIYYNGEIEDDWRKETKLEWINNRQFSEFHFDHITPQKNNWINLTDNDWEMLLPLTDRFEKIGKGGRSVFHLYSNGVMSMRNEWVIDFSINNLLKKISLFIKKYNSSVYSGQINENIKWSESLYNLFNSKKRLSFEKNLAVKILFRPFCKQYLFADKNIVDRLTVNHFQISGQNLDKENITITITGHPSSSDFSPHVSQLLIDRDYYHQRPQCLPLHRYDSAGNRHDNLTDWGLEQFQKHYSDQKISKEDIFHYTYGVLHNPDYRKKYELNLKRDFPRLPFYTDFWKWAKWGKTLMDLHIGYEEEKPFALERKELPIQGKNDDKRKLKVKLKADKEKGIIELDEQTSLKGIPAEAWNYKLGNRSALEGILDQYKEKKPRDKTIAEKFNTYKFAEYKEKVINLLKKVTTVSVETMSIIREMEKEQS